LAGENEFFFIFLGRHIAYFSGFRREILIETDSGGKSAENCIVASKYGRWPNIFYSTHIPAKCHSRWHIEQVIGSRKSA